MTQVQVLNKTGSGGLAPQYVTLKSQAGDSITIAPGQTVVIDSALLFEGNDPILLEVRGVGGGSVPGGGGGQQNPPVLFPTAVPPYSILASQGTANTVVPVTLNPGDVPIYDAASQTIKGINLQQVIATGGRQTFTSTLTHGSMQLGILPHKTTLVGMAVRINGFSIDAPGAYSILADGMTVIAMPSLNVAYGGTNSDGLGFTNGSVVVIEYIPTA